MKITCIKCSKEITPVRKGRADYHCPECDEDITIYLVLLHEAENN
jgi:predicted RNA-binding Zn-ribbon protein involved in translation (DUF1610 family)